MNMGWSAAVLLPPLLLFVLREWWLAVVIYGGFTGCVVGVWWWPVRVLAVTPQGVWLRRYENWPTGGSFSVSSKVRWSDVHEILIASDDSRPLPAVTVVMGRRTGIHDAQGYPVRRFLSVVLCEMPPGWCDPDRLMAAIRMASPGTSVLRLRRAEALTRVRYSYAIGPPRGLIRIAGAVAPLSFLVMYFSPDSASLLIGTVVPLLLAAFMVLAMLCAAAAVAPTVKVEPGGIWLGRWPRRNIRWPDLDSIHVAVVGRSVQLTLLARPDVRLRHGPFGLRRWPPGQTVNHRIPRSWVNLAEFNDVLRAYAQLPSADPSDPSPPSTIG
jgi:hypothetical protein